MIAVDWGSSSLRAFRLDDAGRVIDSRRSSQGVLTCAGEFESVLRQHVHGWDDELIVMCGMIGSRQGWREVPYVECAAGIEQIAAGMARLDPSAFAGRKLWIVPGISLQRGDGIHEVMRGEETQLCGLLDDLSPGNHLVCLAGTHSKHVRIGDERISTFSTFMTGETFDLLGQHSILGKLMQPGPHHAVAFAKGLDLAARGGELLGDLFAVRTQGLFGELNAAWLPSYLSGILIGHELNAMSTSAGPVHLVASAALELPYRSALWRRGFETTSHPESSSARGMHALAEARGLAA
jgi:2-dehydro-3-deoxygalactonokinase